MRWLPIDVTDRRTIATFVGDGCDALVHLAGMASVRQANANPEAAWAVNAQGVAHVAQALAELRTAGARVYHAEAYRLAFASLIACCIGGFLCLLAVRETYCRPQEV